MKIWYRVTITFTMLLVIFALLITGFQLAVYGDSHYGFYKKEYEKYRVTDNLNMKIDNVMAVTEHMMAYLIGKEEKLSIVTDVDGEHQDFFNEQDRLHLADVRNLFLGVAMSIDFTSCFTLFHKLFFTNNLWIFDPETDYMIRMLPEGFFSDMVIRVGVIFIVLLAVPGVAAVVYNWKWKKERN